MPDNKLYHSVDFYFSQSFCQKSFDRENFMNVYEYLIKLSKFWIPSLFSGISK